jgi:hypothetical protein
MRATRAGRAASVLLATGAVLAMAWAMPAGAATHEAVSETTGGEVHTWADYKTAAGTPGAIIPGNVTVTIGCKVRGFKVTDGDTWWYRISSAPWDGKFYGSADAFYNNGRKTGSLKGTPFEDPRIRNC